MRCLLQDRGLCPRSVCTDRSSGGVETHGCRSAVRRGEVGAVAPAASASASLRLVPSGWSLVVGFALLAAALGLYLAARETAVFAVRDVAVESVPPAHERTVRRALADLSGTSLLRIDSAAIERRLEKLPHVHLLAYDRAFPNQLRVRVSVERPAAVLRRGNDRWLVSTEGRILRRLERRLRRPLPVVWAARVFEPEVGAVLAAGDAASAVAAVATIRAADAKLGRELWYVKADDHNLTAVLRDRTELRLGGPADLAVKSAIARRVLATLRREDATVAYLDVSVPARPVAGSSLDSQVES